MRIDETLVRRLVSTQFPQWKDLPVRAVVPGGSDNRTFRLGSDMLVRMPSAAAYADKVEKEQHWLPRLVPFLPLPIPQPLVMGEPGEGYPWRWSIYRWIEGETVTSAPIADLCDFAAQLAEFLIALHHIDPTEGPLPGAQNFYRGGGLSVYDGEVRQAIGLLKGKIDSGLATRVWDAALATTWQGLPMWVHGDISTGNLLVHNGRLSAVIDFGGMAVGDPACDLAIAWTFFEGKSRDVFRRRLSLDADTWARGRGWALWKFMIVAAGLTDWNAPEATDPWRVIEQVLEDHKCQIQKPAFS